MKPGPNHQRYVRVLRHMTPEERLSKAFELSDFSRALFIRGLKERFPDRNPEVFRELALRRLELCRNRSS